MGGDAFFYFLAVICYFIENSPMGGDGLSRIWNSEVNNIRHTQYKCDVCDVNTMTILSGAKTAPELHRRAHL